MMKLVITLLCVSLSAVTVTAQDEAARPTDVVEFTPLLDGTSLDGWEGDTRFWRIEDGVLIGQTTKDITTPKNTFLVYTKKHFGDFELRFSYRVTGGNSGVQYRSQLISNWVVKGLQADFEDKMHGGKDKFSGMFFEENGRMFMGQRGDVVIVRSNDQAPNKPLLEKIATVGSNESLEKYIRRDGWNDYIVIARGNVFLHMINGHVMSIGIDEDNLNAKDSGVIAWQLHAGPPLKIELRDVRIRELK
ncbi:MAG: DUF1080 domain-containing protein [Planctomycetota bacterium]